MNFDIVEIEEFSGRMAKIYSIMLDGDEMTLLDHFFDENEQFEEDLSPVVPQRRILHSHLTGKTSRSTGRCYRKATSF